MFWSPGHTLREEKNRLRILLGGRQCRKPFARGSPASKGVATIVAVAEDGVAALAAIEKIALTWS